MDAWSAAQTRDRYDRHVRRARLSVDSGAPRHRLAFAMEEALRLASLPGEHEGRSYYFRRLRISDLPVNGDRNAWLDRFQRALTEEAEQAIHGADPRAGLAHAVFFRGEQEALEILLHRVLARRAAQEWFWPMVIAAPGAGEPASSTAPILHVLEKLKAQPASWVAVAAALFAAPEFDAVHLLQAIPPALAKAWVRKMEGTRAIPSRAAARIPELAQQALQRAVKVVGFQDTRALWLATLAVLLDSPDELAAGTAVSRARVALSQLISNIGIRSVQAERFNETKTISSEEIGEIMTSPPSIVEESQKSHPLQLPGAEASPDAQPDVVTSDWNLAMPSAVQSDAAGGEPKVSASSPDCAPATLEIPARAAERIREAQPTSLEVALRPDPMPWQCLGLPTKAAGLFFLLNALQRIGMPEALAAGLSSAGPNFAARVLLRLAAQSGVENEDPIMVWLNSVVPSQPDEQIFPCDASCWPSNLQPTRDSAPIEYLVRVWCVAARLWCWRAGRLSVREIVSRGGVFSVNRTDLDVSLPIEEADVRVRGIGLDLDPRWLPWFGRVVRFHYLFRGEFHG